MKKDMLTIIKKEFARFFGDKNLFFTTVIMPGLVIYIMYTLMGQGMMKQFMADDSYVADAYVVNMPEELREPFSALSADWKDIPEAQTEEVKAKIQEKEADVLVVFPGDFSDQVAQFEAAEGKTAPNVAIYYNSTKTDSEQIESLLTELLNDYESSMANKFDINAGEEAYDCATKEDVVGQIFSMMLPMLMMIFLFSGCMAVAPESIAGEKERGTIATLLVTPMKRSSLALGKIISLSAIALLSGVSSFLGTMLSLPNLMGMGAEGMDASVYGMKDYAMLLGLILTTVLLLVAVISVISAYAKSVKAAGTAISPLMIVVMGISLIPMFSGEQESSMFSSLIPLFNSVESMHAIFSFSYNAVQVVLTMVSNLVYAGILTFVLTRMFNDEKVMFSK
ncbi:MAG: ABC transporter permease [Lachnospiraceae bacterium]